MAYSLSPWLKPRFFITGTNRPLAGGLMYTYKAGTTDPATTYSNDTGTPNTNPIQLDSDGQCDLFLDDAVSYRIILKNSAGVTQFDKDRIASIGSTQVQSFNNIAALRLSTGTTRANSAKTLGYYAAGDGGGNYFYWDSTSTATDNGGSIIKPTSVGGAGRWISTESVFNPNMFGAKGDNTTDDTAYVIATISATSTNGSVVGRQNSTYRISTRVNLASKCIKDMVLSYSAGTASLVLSGNSKLLNTTIYVNTTAPSFSSPLSGAVNLHLADGVIIDGLYIPDGSANSGVRIGIFCSTKANDVTVRNCKMDYIAWPLLYNDDTSFISRVVDGVDYAGSSIGRGLTVQNCSFGALDKSQNGDGIEINCPDDRFTDVRVSGCIVNKAIGFAAHGANGIGMGFANIDGLLVDNCYIQNADGSGGGLHCEKSKGVILSNNMIIDCWKGIGIGEDGDDIVIANNTVIRSSEALQIVGGTTSVTNVLINGNCFLNSVTFPMVATNLDGCIISNNLFRNNATAGNAFITLLQSGALATKKITISNNLFRVDNAVSTLVGGVGGVVENIHSYGNIFNGILNNNIAGYMALVRSSGLSQDCYDYLGNMSAMDVTISGTPVGYLAGQLGDLAKDANNGIQYKHNGTSWIPRMGFTDKNNTASRPTLTANDVGVMYLDTTLDADGKPIWWNGTLWVDATGASV